MIFVDVQFAGNRRCHLLAVARQHDDAFNALSLQLCYSLTALFLHLIVDDDVSGIRQSGVRRCGGAWARGCVFYRHMDDRTDMVAVVPFHTDRLHHLRIAHAHYLVAYTGTDTLSGYLFDIAHPTTV